MKKSLLVMLFAVLFAVPVLANDAQLDLIPKIGYIFSPEATIKNGGESVSSSKDSAISIGAEMFFDMQHNFFLGLGIMWGDMTKISSNTDNKLGFTNVYAALKYKVLVNDDEKEPLFVYPLAHIGIPVPAWEYEGVLNDYEIDGVFYWAIGAGCEYKNIIFEAIYGCDYATEKFNYLGGSRSNNLTYTAFRINVGYKFSL